MSNIRVTKCVRFSFTIKNNAGVVDTTTDVTPGSTNTLAMKTVINPNNKREAAACAISLTNVNPNNPVVIASITAFGHSQNVSFTLSAAPDLGNVTIDSVGAEEDVPDWAAAQL